MASLRTGLVLAGLFLVLAWRYAPALSAGFVYEDARWENTCNRGIGSGLSGLARIPMSWSWCAQRGQSAKAYHAVNLALFAALLGMLVLALHALTDHWTASLAGIVIFALHPLTNESVVYLAGRIELMAALAVVTAFWAALTDQWVLMGLALCLGVWTKETAAIAPALIILRKHPLVAITLACSMSLMIGASWVLHMEAWRMMIFSALQLIACGRLLMLTIWPFGQTIAYDFTSISLLTAFAWAALPPAVAYLSWMLWESYPLAAQGLAWMLIGVVLRLFAWSPTSPLNAHQWFLSLIGVSMITASCVATKRRRVLA